MTSASNKDEPAFPVIAENGLGHVSEWMSRRDWYVGIALIGMGTWMPDYSMAKGLDTDAARHARAALAKTRARGEQE